MNVERVKKLFRGELPRSSFNWYIQRKHVLQWGGLSDGFDWYELKDGKSLELLEFFVREAKYPVSISSKNTWLLDYIDGGKYAEQATPYWELFKEGGSQGLIHWKSSIISGDEAKVKEVEAGVGPTKERFRLLKELTKVGVVTTFRFRPFILGISADYPYTTRSYLQLDELYRMAQDAGCYSATTEFLCLESRAAESAQERFAKIGVVAGLGPQLLDWYKERSMKKSGLLRLNYDIKRPYMDAMFELADKYGMKMFVSDAHHKEKSFHAGCCGLPTKGPLSNSFKGHFAEAILIAKEKGYVRWADIETEAAQFKNVPFTQKEGFNVGDTRAYADMMFLTMFDYMKNAWNNPKSFSSPNRYFGGALVASPDVDSEGNIVYLYNKPFIDNQLKVKSAKELQIQLVEQGYAMQEDGAEWGHVAYPVYIEGVSTPTDQLYATLNALEKGRFQYRVFVDEARVEAIENDFPQAEVDAMPQSAQSLPSIYITRVAELDGVKRFWYLTGHAAQGFLRNGQPVTARAYLSAKEAEYVEKFGDVSETYVRYDRQVGVIVMTEAKPEGELE